MSCSSFVDSKAKWRLAAPRSPRSIAERAASINAESLRAALSLPVCVAMTLAFSPGKICVCWLRYVAGRRRHKALAKMQANVIQIIPFCLECPSNGAADAGTASAGSLTFERSESLAICRSRISPGNTFVRWLDGSDASSRAVGFALHCGQVTPESFSVSPHFWQNAEPLAVRRSFVLGIVDAPVKRFSIEMLSVAE